MSHTYCSVIDYGGTSPGSFIPAIAALVRSLTASGNRCIVFASTVEGERWSKQLCDAGADLRFIDGRRALRRSLRAETIDLVHTHFTRYDLSSLCVPRTTRLVWHVHTLHERTLAARIRALLKYRVLGRRVDAIVPVSFDMASVVDDWWYGEASRVHVIRNGIDTRHFRPPSASERARARAALGILDERKAVLFFERLPIKGGDTLLRALENAPQFRLIVAGGTEADRSKFDVLRNVVGVKHEPDVRQLYWAADVLAFPSVREGFGFVLVEALACGLPVAASDIAVVREIAAELEAVVRFPAHDARALREALVKAVSVPRPALEAARAHAADSFDLTVWVRNVRALYDDLLPAGDVPALSRKVHRP